LGAIFLSNEYDFKELKLIFESLSVYRYILKRKIIKELYTLINYISSGNYDLVTFISYYNDFYNNFINNNINKYTLKDCIQNYVLFEDNPLSNCIEVNGPDNLDDDLKKATSTDLKYLEIISNIKCSYIKDFAIENLCKNEFQKDLVNNLPDFKNSTEDSDFLTTDYLIKFHQNNGSGIFSKYAGFVWEGKKLGLKGIVSPDPITLSALSGYEFERKIIIDNTVHFLNGFKGNNILIYGDRGTGKSATVKAILNEYCDKNLRLIEIPIMFLCDIPDILRIVKNRKQKFILFIDDLAFEDSENTYTALKAVLEGGLESRPKNVIIYATSNRRHLVKEKFSERNDEVHGSDTIQEKLSLADRFGISVTFSSPDKNRYLKIVENIALRRNLDFDLETLHSEALKWEIRYNGRSARTATQFVDWFETKLSDGKIK
jgi:predicted AAA+ superfamily ATPase